MGVHIRGTDFRGCYNNHPIYVDAQDCFHVIDRLLDNKKYNKVFVATDDKRILTKFIAKYGNRMCYYKDVVRSDKNVSVAFRKEKRKNNIRKEDKMNTNELTYIIVFSRPNTSSMQISP